jgi:hypothetical protein
MLVAIGSSCGASRLIVYRFCFCVCTVAGGQGKSYSHCRRQF